MKHRFLIIMFPMLAAYAQAESTGFISKMEQDKQSYQTFLELGQAACMTELFRQTKLYRQNQSSNLYSLHFSTLYALQSPLAYNFSGEKMKKTFDRYRQQNIEPLIQQYRQREEYFNIRRSPMLICSRLFSENASTRQLYSNFLKDSVRPPNRIPEYMQERIGKWSSEP